jgi:hypothetical protein
MLAETCEENDFTLHAPPLNLCSDNAVMIAWAGLEHFERGADKRHGFRAALALAARRGRRSADRRGQAGSQGMSARIAVLGAGAWGTALAASFARAGQRLPAVGPRRETVAAINDRHRNPRYLGDIALPSDLRATTDLGAALSGAP